MSRSRGRDIGVYASAMPLITVLISTYNRPDLLRQALQSVLAQTVQDFEVLVRDDAGRPGEVERVISEMTDPRIHYRRNETNLGDCGTNFALYREAQGEYLAHLDDDDRWKPRALETFLGALQQHSEVGLAFSNQTICDASGQSLGEAEVAAAAARWGRAGLTEGLQANGRYLAAVVRAAPVSNAAMIRRSTLDISRLDDRAASAWDMWVASQAVRQTGLAWFEPEGLSLYRRHSASLSLARSSDRKFAGLTWCLRQLARDPKFVAERPELRRRLARQEVNWGLNQIVRERRPVGVQHLLKGLTQS